MVFSPYYGVLRGHSASRKGPKSTPVNGNAPIVCRLTLACSAYMFSFCACSAHSRQRERLQVPFRAPVKAPERNESRTERKGGVSFRSFRASETPPRQFLSIPFGVRIFVRVIQSVVSPPASLPLGAPESCLMVGKVCQPGQVWEPGQVAAWPLPRELPAPCP